MQLPDSTLSVLALRSPLISCTTRKEFIPGEGAASHNYTLFLHWGQYTCIFNLKEGRVMVKFLTF